MEPWGTPQIKLLLDDKHPFTKTLLLSGSKIRLEHQFSVGDSITELSLVKSNDQLSRRPYECQEKRHLSIFPYPYFQTNHRTFESTPRQSSGVSE